MTSESLLTEDVRPSVIFARVAAGVMVVALLTQFLLGMYVNLYVPTSAITGPSHGSSSTGMFGGSMMSGMGRAMSGSSGLMLHMMLGWLLLLGALVTFFGALVSRRRRAVVLAVLGIVSIAAAGIGGLEFMMYGRDGYSLLMASGFAAAVASYFAESFALR